MLGYGDFWGNLKILEIRGLKRAVFLMLFLHVLVNVMCYLQCSWGVSHMFPCLLIVLNITTASPIFFWSRSMMFFKMCPTVPICSTHIPYDFHSSRPNGSDGCFDKFICMCTNYVPHVFAIEFQPNATFDFSHKHSQHVKSSGSGFKFLLPGPELSSFCWNWHKNQIIKLAFC